jgi:1-acyl-sn-glycerol-3-phosphate acyltransferase
VVAIFPEAAYGPREGELQELKKGFAHFAIQSGAPVLPVALSGTKDLWLGKTIELRIGLPLESRGLDVDQLVGIARDRMTELIPAYTERPGRQPFRRLLTRLLY